MQNLLREGAEMMSEAEDEATRDAVMIAAAQKVEHYEIASYGTMQTWANRLGKRDIAGLLEDTLEEEKEADQKLTMVAESLVNPRAAHDEDEEEARPARAASNRRRSR
jgi:ferritin-like metal-binding protein YciE